MLNDTIVAISTALQEGAIAIIRLSGEDAIEIVNRIFSRDLTKVASHTITYGNIIHEGNIIDEVLVSVFKAPKTFTKEDIVEINTHGGKYITREVLSLCLAHGARLALPGEFTKRAYLNGRIDLAQAEAIHDLIQADNKFNHQLAIKGLKGSVTKLMQPLELELLNIIANIEVNIDYPEYEDIEILTNEKILPMAKQWLSELQVILQRAKNTKTLKQGVKTVIVGQPNVGKSSLLNALIEEDKAIVTDIAGTTRDLVEGVIHLENITLHLIDTAGIHQTSDVVEKIGIEKSLSALDEAELVIVVIDGSKELDENDQRLLDLTQSHQRIVVYNKHDISKQDKQLTISAKNHDIKNLVDEINRRYQNHQEILDQPSLNNDRQIACLMQAYQEMEDAIEALNQQVELDLVTIHLQSAYQAIKEVTGKASKEDLLDALFSNFCLGK